MLVGALVLIGAGVWLTVLWSGTAEKEQGALPRVARPNVVLISLDTTRPDHLGCYGYGKPTSPNLDKLAADGVRFACARTQAPWTIPSHMTVFTSQIPSHHGVEDFCASLPSDVPTLARVLKEH